MVMKDRDKQIIEFIRVCPCRSYVLDKLFFNNQRSCNRRLSILADYGHIKRYRESPNHHYYYWIDRKPVQIEHMNRVAEVFCWIKYNGYNILKFKREVHLGEIRPDGVVGIEKNGSYGILLIEVERSNNVLSKKIKKYDKMFQNGSYRKYGFNKMPKILYVSNRNVESRYVELIQIKIKGLELIF